MGFMNSIKKYVEDHVIGVVLVFAIIAIGIYFLVVSLTTSVYGAEAEAEAELTETEVHVPDQSDSIEDSSEESNNVSVEVESGGSDSSGVSAVNENEIMDGINSMYEEVSSGSGSSSESGSMASTASATGSVTTYADTTFSSTGSGVINLYAGSDAADDRLVSSSTSPYPNGPYWL